MFGATFRRELLASSRSQRFPLCAVEVSVASSTTISRHLRGRPTIIDEGVVADISFPHHRGSGRSLVPPDCDSL
jgi:hypothetical protein